MNSVLQLTGLIAIVGALVTGAAMTVIGLLPSKRSETKRILLGAFGLIIASLPLSLLAFGYNREQDASASERIAIVASVTAAAGYIGLVIAIAKRRPD